MSQINEEAEGGNEDQTVLQRVLDGHVERTTALREKAGGSSFCVAGVSANGVVVLESIIEAEPSEAQRLMDGLMLEKKETELAEARKIALLRSGARGWEARSEENKAEKELQKAEERYVHRCLYTRLM